MTGAIMIPLMILGMALINIALRWPVYLFADRFRFPPLIERALAFVPAAVLTAIVVPTVLFPKDGVPMDLSGHNPALPAAVIAAIVGRVTKNLMATIVVAMVAFLLLRWYLGG